MLPKNCRLSLKQPEIFKKAYKVIENPFFRVYLLKTDESRGAVVVPKKQVLKSSDRNLIKRRIAAIIYKLLPALKSTSIIILAKRKSLEVDQFRLAEELKKTLNLNIK